MEFELEIDQRGLLRTSNRYLGEVLEAGVTSIRVVTRTLEKDLEAVTRSAAGGKLWRAWQSDTFPDKADRAYNPSGVVSLKGRSRTTGAMRYWSTPGLNRAKSGGWLAIPTKNAGVLTRDRNLTPAEWERKNRIKLEFVYRGGSRAALLMADLLGRDTKRGRKFAAATAGRRKSKLYRGATVRKKVIFVLIAQQRHANAFSVKPFFEKAQRELPKDYARRVADAIQRSR